MAAHGMDKCPTSGKLARKEAMDWNTKLDWQL
jgi:hypothetical protein